MRKTGDLTDLRGVAYFKGFSPATLSVLSENVSWHDYKAAEQIIAYMDACHDVFVLISGKAQVIIYADNGKAVGFRHIHAGEIFGEYSAIDGLPRSACVEALAKCRVLRIPQSQFWRLLHDEASFREVVLRHFVSQLRGMTARIYEFSTLAVQHRIHAELVRLANGTTAGDNSAIVISPAPTNADIAIRISTHREAVSRELARLARHGLVRRKGKTIVIEDLEGLKNLGTSS